MQTYAYIVPTAGWLVWFAPFVLIKRTPTERQTTDRRARWGIALQAVGFSILWQGRFWERSLHGWQVLTSVAFLVLASVLSWSGSRALGRQWRVDAGLNRDHELVRSGPYRMVRHPIYASMLCVLIGTGLMITPWLLFILSLMFFVAGAEIRMRIEDRLLAERFGEQHAAYRRTTAAYIPFVR